VLATLLIWIYILVLAYVYGWTTIELLIRFLKTPNTCACTCAAGAGAGSVGAGKTAPAAVPLRSTFLGGEDAAESEVLLSALIISTISRNG
jgi:hypothetical protein